MQKEVTTFLETIQGMSYWNARCCKLGASMSLTTKAPTQYRNEHRGNSANQTQDKRQRLYTRMNTKAVAPNKHQTKCTDGTDCRITPSSYWDERHWHYTAMNGTDLIPGRITLTSQMERQALNSLRDYKHWPNTGIKGTDLIPGRQSPT